MSGETVAAIMQQYPYTSAGSNSNHSNSSGSNRSNGSGSSSRFHSAADAFVTADGDFTCTCPALHLAGVLAGSTGSDKASAQKPQEPQDNDKASAQKPQEPQDSDRASAQELQELQDSDRASAQKLQVFVYSIQYRHYAHTLPHCRSTYTPLHISLPSTWPFRRM
jgi:hypothetical protein